MRLQLRSYIVQRGSSTTLQDLDLAVDDKIEEGRRLLISGCWNGSIYLLGYAVEMILKIGYIKAANSRARPTANVGYANKEALIVGKALIPTVDAEGYHSLLFWSKLIAAVRRGKGRPFSQYFALEFRQRTRRMHELWKVDMRYLPKYSNRLEAEQFLEDVLWLRGQEVNLWS